MGHPLVDFTVFGEMSRAGGIALQGAEWVESTENLLQYERYSQNWAG